MEEVKKKVFNWKRLLIIGAIILLVLAMTPLFWRNMIIDSLEPYCFFELQEGIHSDSKIIVLVSQKYNRHYEEELFTVKDFKYDNIEKIEYCNEQGTKTEFHSDWVRGIITVHLKKAGMDEVKKAIVRLKGLKFVDGARGYMGV